MLKLESLLFFLFLSTLSLAQTQTPGITLGMRYSDQSQMQDGYLLYSPSETDEVFLINNCGSKVNEWTFSGSYNATGTYLLENSSVAKLIYNNEPGVNQSHFGDGCIEVRDWEDNPVWMYCAEDEYRGMHSDLHSLPNGNFLAIVQTVHTYAEILALGLDPEDLFSGNYETESCIEIQPTGPDSGTIVWEWHMFDHMIQDYDSTIASTFGVISDHPERYEMGLENGFIHFNSIDYNPDLDIIVFSNYSNDEVYIIDHSTSSAEAAGTTGGNFGMGGDIIYRWGRPSNYETQGDQKLDGQHNPRFVEEGPWVGSISVFNNGYGGLNGTSGSAACIFTPVLDTANLVFAKDSNGAFLPNDFDFAWNGDVWPGDDMNSQWQSGVDFLANGNFVTCEAALGRFTEVTPDGTVVWIYKSPFVEGSLEDQGSLEGQVDNLYGEVYKVEKYSSDYAAFTDITLNLLGPVENENSLSFDCQVDPYGAPNNASIIAIDNEAMPFCATEFEPILSVNNYGINEITELEIVVEIDGNIEDTISWIGSLSYLETELIQLPLYNFIITGSNNITVEIVSVNNGADDVPEDNIITFDFGIDLISPMEGDFVLVTQTDEYGEETTVRLLNSAGVEIYSNSNFLSSFTTIDTLSLTEGECYTLEVVDSFGDGIFDSGGVFFYEPSGELLIGITGDFTFESEDFYVGAVPNPLAEAAFTFEEDSYEIDFTDNSINAVTWLWDFGDGMTSTEESPSYTYAGAGTYTVCLTVTNIDSIPNQVCQDITIEEVNTSVSDFHNVEFTLYPNPASDIINIQSSEPIDSYRIYSVHGKTLYSVHSAESIVNVKDLEPGIYYLELNTVEGARAVRNFTKF